MNRFSIVKCFLYIYVNQCANRSSAHDLAFFCVFFSFSVRSKKKERQRNLINEKRGRSKCVTHVPNVTHFFFGFSLPSWWITRWISFQVLHAFLMSYIYIFIPHSLVNEIMFWFKFHLIYCFFAQKQHQLSIHNFKLRKSNNNNFLV